MAHRISFATLPLITMLALVPASAVASAPDPVDQTIPFLPGEACAFGVTMTVTGTGTGTGGVISLADNPTYSRIWISPNQRLTLTNTADPSKSVTVLATGVFHETFNQDGSSDIFATGHNLFLLPEIGVTAIATTGPVTLHRDAEGVATDLDLSGATQVFDVCAAIT